MSYKVVQISDTHLMANRAERVANVPTWASCCAVLDDIDERHGDFDLLVVTGDLAQDELEATYRHLREGLGERLSRSRVIPGNHDDRPALRKVFPEFFSADAHWLTFAVDCGNWRVVGLDSQITGKVDGALSADQLEWLDDELTQHTQPHLIFLHHPPLAIGVPWMDGMRLRDEVPFLELLSKYAHVKAVSAGHVHQPFSQTTSAPAIYTAPSTCFQFGSGLDKSIIATHHGYRVFELQDDTVRSEVARIQAVT